MPPHSDEKYKFYINLGGGVYEELAMGTIDISESIEKVGESANEAAKMARQFGKTYTISFLVGANNWRRLHGLPMRRRHGKCYKRHL